MQDRRKKMDDETGKAFEKVNLTLHDIKLGIAENHAFNKGLNLKSRMKSAEDDIKTKASWNGLYLAVILILAIVGAALAIAKGV